MRADKPFVTAIIVGAGNGTRMGGKNKALIKIGDKSAFRLVAEAFLTSVTVDEIVVVCRDEAEMMAEVSDLKAKPIRYTLGGRTRAESVMNGIKAAKGANFYCIHDCARPLVTPDIIDSVVSAAFKSGAATACGPVNDTIKYVNRDNGTVYTPDRSCLVAVQTPQVFDSKVYAISVAVAAKDGYTSTDDTALAEHAGFKVDYVWSETPNFKLTRAEDVYLARLLYKLSEKEEQV